MARRDHLHVQTDLKLDNKKWWHELKYMGVLLPVVGVIIFGLGVGLGCIVSGFTNTEKSKPVPSPLPTANSTSDLGKTTTTPSLTIEELHEQQELGLEELPLCQLVYQGLKVIDVLYKNPEDALVDELILTRYILVPRCDGFCVGFCKPSRTADEDFVVMYVSENGTIQYAKRKVMHHKECQCVNA